VPIILIFFLNFELLAKSEFPSVFIKSCYDGDTCTAIDGEKIRLACINTPELKGENSETVKAIKARDFLNTLVAQRKISIRRIAKDRYGRTVAELYKGRINIQELIVKKGFGKIYKKYAFQCDWTN